MPTQHIAPTTALRHTWLYAIGAGLYATVTIILDRFPFFSALSDLPGNLEASLSFAMGVLLVVRLNRAYERWWEARTLWGTLVNISRNLAIKFRETAGPDEAQKKAMRGLIVDFSVRLKEHLRGKPTAQDATADYAVQHVPAEIARQVYSLLHAVKENGQITDQEFFVIDRESRVLMDVCGACERIRNTLMPLSLRSFVRQCLFAYLVLLPWGLVEFFAYWTAPVTIVIAYLALSAEGIARYVEEPFGETEDHLDLESICQGIDRSVTEILR